MAVPVTLSVFVVLVGLLSAQDPNAKCRQPFTFNEDDFPVRFYDYVVVYNISSTKNVQSCVDFLETYTGPKNDNFTIAYTEGGVKYRRPGITSYVNNKGSFFFQDNPNEVLDYYGTIEPSGVLIGYICKGDEQFIWVSYEFGKDLSKEADEVAKGLTDTPADYKIGRDGC